MKRWSVLVLGAIVPLALAAEDQPAAGKQDAKEILKKVDAAAKAVKAARYEVVTEGVGDAKDTFASLRGQYVLEGWFERQPKKYYADVHAKVPGAEGEKHLTFGCDGETYYLVDHDAKKVYADMDPAVIGSRARIMFVGMMLEFVHPEPFGDELNGEATLKGEAEVAGEPCHEIHVKYAQANAGDAVWLVSTKDYLPRQRIDDVNLPNGKTGQLRKTITKLEVDPKNTDEQFKLVVPEGYEKVDDFAP